MQLIVCMHCTVDAFLCAHGNLHVTLAKNSVFLLLLLLVVAVFVLFCLRGNKRNVSDPGSQWMQSHSEPRAPSSMTSQAGWGAIE